MKLLICTQAVDLDDPVLGFFHDWIREFASQCETVHVICLKKGRHELPANVFIHSLGKERGVSRAGYVRTFYRSIRTLRKEYDAVFVHMNPEYAVLGGALWRAWGKRTAFWYVHWSVTTKLRVAATFVDEILTASAGSFPLRSRKVRVLGHGIDTSAFERPRSARQGSMLFLGRLDPSKRADVFVEALEKLHERQLDFKADIVGSPSKGKESFAHDVRNLGATLALEGKLTVQEAVSHEKVAELFASHAVFCNLSKAGMFDKTTLEAMASGCLVVTTNAEFEAVLPEKLIPPPDAASVAKALQAALDMPESERTEVTKACREWIAREHSLQRLITAIVSTLAA